MMVRGRERREEERREGEDTFSTDQIAFRLILTLFYNTFETSLFHFQPIELRV